MEDAEDILKKDIYLQAPMRMVILGIERVCKNIINANDKWRYLTFIGVIGKRVGH
jgi:hypothetical protein